MNLKINSKYNATIIGVIFTVVSLGLYFTFVVPFLSILFGVLIESLFGFIFESDSEVKVPACTIITLISALLVALFILLIRDRKLSLKTDDILVFMVIMFFVLHALGFYIWWGLEYGFKSDGQLIFTIFESYPYSSFGFIPLGLFIDAVKKRIPSNSHSD